RGGWGYRGTDGDGGGGGEKHSRGQQQSRILQRQIPADVEHSGREEERRVAAAKTRDEQRRSAGVRERMKEHRASAVERRLHEDPQRRDEEVRDAAPAAEIGHH